MTLKLLSVHIAKLPFLFYFENTIVGCVASLYVLHALNINRLCQLTVIITVFESAISVCSSVFQAKWKKMISRTNS